MDFFAPTNKHTAINKKTDLEVEVVIDFHVKVQALQRRLEGVSVDICSISRFETEPLVEVHVIEDDGAAAARVVHVVHLGVALDGHADDGLEGGRGDGRGGGVGGGARAKPWKTA